jgi:sirohydrochlorin ferrochelatase
LGRKIFNDTLKTMLTAPRTEWFLFDNGSVRPDSTLSLRRLATAVSGHIGREVQPVSLLHSTKVEAEALDGMAARLLEPALVEFFTENPTGEAVLMPLFFGPSAALTEYVPARVEAVRARFPEARVRLAPWMVNPTETDSRMAEILADQVRMTVRALGWQRPRVILVDHGSPQPSVAVVRNHLGEQVRAILGDTVAGLAVASMERREGEAYAFNEPLLATVLSTPPFNQGEVVIALQFLSPGRHAGPGGDIADICHAAEQASPGLQTQMTEPIAADTRLVALLTERLEQAKAL